MNIPYLLKCSSIKFKQFILFAAMVMITLQSTAQVPLNDDPCSGTSISAITLTASAACTYSTFSNVDASNSTGTGIPNPTCANFTDADVWFRVVVPTGATSVVIDTKQIVLQDGGMAVYTASGTCPNLVFTQLACDDNSSNNLGMPKLTVTQPAGTVLYVRFWGFGGEVGTFGICVTANIPPANNECANAELLTVNPNLLCGVIAGGTCANSTLSTTTPLPTCGTANTWDDDVWYKFVATSTTHRISLLSVAGSSTAMVINLYSVPPGGDCTNLVQENCAVGNTLNAGSLTIGKTYYVRVYTNVINAASNTTFSICIGTPPPPPANDECAGAISLPVNPDYNCGLVTAGTTVSATQSATLPTPTCAIAGAWNDDVWFTFTATSTGHRVSLQNVTGSTTDMTTAVYSGTCGALVQLQCATVDPNVINLTGLTVGQVYYVRVMTGVATATIDASFNICVGTAPPPPANDDCPNAVTLTVNPNYACGVVTAATTISATTTTLAPTPSCSPTGINDDVWFKFTATATSQRISLLNIVGSATALTTVVYSGVCGTGSLTEITCNTTNLFNVTGLTVGQTYYVRVFTTVATVGSDCNFNICIGTPPPPPVNDECTGAIPLTVNANQLCGVTTAGTTSGATQSSTLPTPTCSGANGWDDDVWYSFVAVSNNHSISLTNVTGLTTNMLTSVYQGTCGSLTQIACATVDPNFISLSTLTPGQTYYVRVQTELAGTDANFNVCIGTPGPGAVCSAGNPFCSTLGVTYPSVTNQPSLGGGGVYGCLGSTPNPTWFVMQVSTPGTLVFQVSQTTPAGTGIDVDYAAWGPFTSQTDGCTQIGATPATITPISCSYSTAAIETVTIPNALVGQWYIVLITNFNGGAGTIQFNTTTGNVGSTNCNIVCNTTASNNGPVCLGGSFNLTSTAIAGSTFAWTGPGFTSTQQNPTNVTAPTTAGSYTYSVTATSGSVACSGTTTLVVAPTPPVPTVVTPITYCQGANAVPLTATVTTAGNILTYYTVPTGGTGVATITPSTATIGSTTYYVSQKTGNCEGPRASIVVNVVATTTPAVTITGSPVVYCQNATASSLASNATASSGGTLNWYTVASGGTASATPITPSTTASGSTTYYVSQTIGTCEGPRSPIVVNVTATSAAPTVTTPVNYCQNAPTVALTATGTNILWWGTSSTGGTSSNTAPTPSSATAGTVVYYVTQNTNGCVSNPRTPIAVTVNAIPAAPGVTSPVTYCQNATATPLTATGTNLTWYATATAPTGTATAPTPVTTTVGSTTYWVGAQNGTCQSPRSSITVIVNATPLAPTVTTPVTYCQGATATALTATGTNLLWYTSLTGTGSATAITPVTTTAGTTNYYVSSTIGTCEGPKATIAVVTNPTPAAPTVVTPYNYCQGATATSLAASGLGLLWYNGPIGGTGSAITPIPSTATGGTFNYYVSSTQGTCEGPRANIVVNVVATPAAPTVTTPVVYCQAGTSVPLTATGTSLLWYTSLTGTGSATAPTPVTTTAGNTTYYVSQSTTGTPVCEGPKATIVVTVNPKPAAPTVVSPRNICANITAAALTATGTNLLWYTTATSTPGSTTAPVPTSSTVGATSYFVSQSALNCEGPRAEIVVNVRPAITVDAGPNVIIARGATTQLNATTSAAAGSTYLWTANVSPAALTSTTILNPVANPIQTTIYKLTVTDPSSPCPASSSNVTVTVVQSCINVRNAFTPNGDGKNDTWFVYDQNFCLATNGCHVNVFNRYGTKVYESQGYVNNWDGTYKGKPLPDGTYYAVIDFVLFDGSKQTIRKDVTILR